MIVIYTPAYTGRRAVVHEHRRFSGVRIVSRHDTYADADREARWRNGDPQAAEPAEGDTK